MFFSRYAVSLKQYVWILFGIFIIFGLMFVLYVRAEKEVDDAYARQQQEHDLVDELEQSSHDLTRMVHAYVIEKDKAYKKEFEHILDIRNGVAPHPLDATDVYVNITGVKGHLAVRYGKAESLMKRIKEAGFTKEEISKLEDANFKSDALVKKYCEAIALVDGEAGFGVKRQEALGLIFGSEFINAKAGIMLPILEAHTLVHQRTAETVKNAQEMARIMLVIFISSGMLFFLVLWRTYYIWSKLYLELEEARHKAQKAEAIKADFMANMSHEIRTPLNGIVGFVNLLSKSSLNTDQARYISIIQNSIDSLLSIVNDILDFTKIAEGKKEVELLEVNPKVEFDKALMLFEAKAKDKNINYHVNIDPSLASCVKMDIFMTKQVMLNLINNAIKFTQENGSITIVIRVINDSADSQLLRFEVEDNGPGISEENRETIFEKFSQADISTTRKYGGSGLGLSIAYSSVSMMGGELKVQSQVGKGSLFFFDLNVDKCAAKVKVAQEIGMGDTFMAEGLAVLVAEDQDVNQMLIDEYLKCYGIRADFANNGEEAVAMAQLKEYDLILMDINMPIMDGMEATHLIHKSQPDIPIVALTANALEGDCQRFMEAGMNEYLIKPINVSALEAILRHAKSLKHDQWIS